MGVRTVHANMAELLHITLADQREGAQQKLSDDLFWPSTELGQAIAYLAHKSAFPLTVNTEPVLQNKVSLMSPTDLSKDVLDGWITRFVDQMGLEAEPLQSTYADAAAFLANAGPVLLQLPPQERGGGIRFVALLRGGTRWLHLIAKDGSIQLVRPAALRAALWADLVERQRANIETMLQNAGVTVARRPQVQQAILQEILGASARQNGWLLRVPPRVGIQHHAQQSGMGGMVRRLVGGYFAQLLLTIGAWWMIGQAALAGHFDLGWLLGWALLLLTTIPFQAWMNLLQSELAIGVGAIFKQRLLFGVMQLEPEEIRHQGAGQFLGRVLASEMVEQLGLASGFVAILAFLQLAAAALVLAFGIGGWLHALLLLLWVAVSIGLSYLYWRRSQNWVDTYREMTNDLVERMVGHRTRLAQEGRDQWHTMEDQVLNHYQHLQRKLDVTEGALKALVPRGWMVIGVVGLLYALLFAHPSPVQIAISLGGILFAYQALTTIVLGLKSILGAHVAWQEIRTLFHAAGRAVLARSSTLPPRGAAAGTDHKGPIVTVRDVAFRYQTRGRPILQGCNLELYFGERLLLEGPSGGGKSTLAALLAGLRVPQSGLLLLHNVDQQTMGIATWRERVVAVPQFHENYILTGTLAFNLLMGRRWPPQPSDVAAAEALCRELGLGDLIDRMPAGMQQMVGESGWQLSHGERSRVYIARALLQDADLLILDESFAALDPENLERALQCVLARAKTLLVIAHP